LGLFDTVKIGKNIVLPIPQEGIDPTLLTYQTKDLDKSLSTFLFEDGRLFEFEKSYWLEEEVPPPVIDEIPKFTNRTVMIQFYEHINDISETEDAWLEYEAIFVDGILSKPIRLVEFKKTSNQFRKDFARQFKEQYESENKLAISPHRYYIYPYRWFKYYLRESFLKSANQVYKFSQFLFKIGLKIK
jgi:hypothetical protein